jgi:hypothetical protein
LRLTRRANRTRLFGAPAAGAVDAEVYVAESNKKVHGFARDLDITNLASSITEFAV